MVSIAPVWGHLHGKKGVKKCLRIVGILKLVTNVLCHPVHILLLLNE